MSSGAKAILKAQKSLGVSSYCPLLFQCQLAKKWALSGAWSPKNLSEQSPMLQVKRSKDKHFMYIEGGRSDMLQDHGEATQIVEMETGKFFTKCSQQSKFGEFHYFTGRIAECFPSLLPHDWDQFIMEEVPGVKDLDSLGYMSIWLGGLGSTTQSHYDIANNCFLQLHGSKRIRLWHPKLHLEMCPYPDAHPRARKSRLSPQALDLLEPFMDVVLSPGDALFIPPFWFHHVEVVKSNSDMAPNSTPSVSLNVFSQSQVSRGFGAALSLPPPKLTDNVAFARHLGGLALALDITPSTCYHIYSSRYLPPSEHVFIEEDIKFAHLSDLSPGAERYIEAFKAVCAENWEQKDPAYINAVKEICFAHLAELIALRNFGASSVKDCLKSITT